MPLDDVRVVLGGPLGEQRYLVAVVAAAHLQKWEEQQPDDRAAGRLPALVPDALTLPRPAPDRWTALTQRGRVVCRCGDGSGFATSSAAFITLWRAGGCPLVDFFGDALPPGFDQQKLSVAAPPSRLDQAAARLDLRRGVVRDGGAPATTAYASVASLPRAAAIGLAAILAHSALALADLHALGALAEESRSQALQALERRGISLSPGAEPRAALARLSAPAAGSARGRFLPLLSKTSAALAPLDTGLAVRAMQFAEDDGNGDAVLILDLTADTLTALQEIEAALAEAGLAPVGGASSSANGGAEMRLTVRDGGA